MVGGGLAGMVTMLFHACGLAAGILIGGTLGLPIRRRIIRRWAVKG